MDDLVDLSWSDSSKPTSKSPTPQATASSSTSFDFLSLSKPLSASSGGNTPNYYSSTPLRSSTPSQPPVPRLNGVANNAKPISRSATPIQSSTPQLGAGTGAGGLDAFSSLLAMPSSSTNAINKNMSMAERQKAMEDEKKRKDEEDRKRFEAEGHFWDNLGSSSSAHVVKPPTKPVVESKNDFDDFLKPTPSTRPKSPLPPPAKDILSPNSSSGPSKPSSSAGTFWDDHHDSGGFFSGSNSKPSQAPIQSRSSPAPPVDPFDFDALSASMSQPQSQAQTNGANGNSHTLDDDEFDILGDLGKPVTARPPKVEPGPSRSSKNPAASSRPSSPPPHIVGQIVEMGFSPIQARQALSKTSTGLDVQAALEILLGGQNTGSNPDPRSHEPHNFGEDDEDEDFIERERQRREEEERERRRRRRQGPSRESVKARSAEEREKEASTQEQAEKILAQASEIGTNMFNKATSFWNSSKERAMKAYEEQRKVMEANAAAAGANGEARKPVKDGRPRWMIEGNDDDWKDQPSGKEKGGFRDDDNEDDAIQTRPKGKQSQTNGAGPSRTPAPASAVPNANPSSNYKSSKERADLLFADESPRYVSPARHPKKSPIPTPAPPKALPSRTLVSATSGQLEKSATYKGKGNEHFKLGRFAEAESSYTTAISQLPEGHLFLIPLHNNRAAARLKLGDSSPAVEDCTTVIDLIGPTYHPTKEAPLPSELAREVKLFDGLVKALSKRAQAWEMGEKWKNALEDWEKILGMDLSVLGAGASGTKNLAADGARRARKMLEGDSNSKSNTNTATTTVKPRPRPAVATTSVTAKPADVNRSAAVSELRAAAKQLELEDDQRLALKDSIEAKLNNWKNGKETNLRALIASLDLVLWDEIMKTGGMKVGMHELISEKQVKIRYMKVIARLHPDKLNSQNTTVEQRMLANGAFGTLNEAWQAFNK